MSQAIMTLINSARNESEKSSIRCTHGALITKGKKILTKGFNHERTRFKKLGTLCSCHAEQDVIMKLLSLKGWRKLPWRVL